MGFISAAVPGTQSPVEFFPRSQRSDSIDSAVFMRSDLFNGKGEGFLQLEPLLSEELEVESASGGALQIVEHGDVHVAGSIEKPTETYVKIHNDLIHSVNLVEKAAQKLYEALEKDIHLQAIKGKEVKAEKAVGVNNLTVQEGLTPKRPDAGFYIFDEILKFKNSLFPAVQEAIQELGENLYSEDAFTKLHVAKQQLHAQHLLVTHNLPPPQSALFKYSNYFLEAISTLTALVVTVLVMIGILPVFTMVPGALAALACLCIQAWIEKKTLPENNKNIYLTKFEKLHVDTANALKVMEEDMNVLELRRESQQARQAQLQALQQYQQAQIIETRKIAEAQTQKLLDVFTQPALNNASNIALIAELEKRINSFSEEELSRALKSLSREKSPSPDQASSRAQEAPAALIGQA